LTGEYRAYKIEDAAGVLQYRAVVQGTAAGAVKKPTAENEGKFVGVTQEAQATQYRSVVVKESGRTAVVAAGVIAVGDAVQIGDNTGAVVSAQLELVDLAESTAVPVNVIGFARTAAGASGDIIEMQIAVFVKLTPVS